MTPADALFATTSFRKLTYPTIFSSTVAGYVESLGEGVTKVKVGDRVVSGTSIWTSGGDHRYGGMQRFTVVEEYEAMEVWQTDDTEKIMKEANKFQIGDVDFGEAIAGAIQVGASAIFGKSTLNMDRPTNPLNPTPNGKKILIWGGASAMGALGIRHASAAGYTVISTSSPKNFSLLKERGAAHVFDYNDESTIDQIRNLFPIDYFYDCVSLPESIGALIKLLSPPNLPVVKADILTLVPASMFGSPELPEGVTTKMMLFRNGDEENKEYVEWLLKKDGYLQTGLKEGWIRGVRPESIGGLEAVDAGIRRRALPGLKGVSGARLIVEPWKM